MTRSDQVGQERHKTNGEFIASALACGRRGCPCGRRVGKDWVSHCPVHTHNDQNPSLSARDGDRHFLVHCFGGCSQRAVIAALREQRLWPERGNTASVA